MPQALPFITCADQYTSALTIGPSQQIASVQFAIQNNNVLAQIAKLDSNGKPYWDLQEIPFVPGSGGFGSRIYGVRFRNAVAGSNGLVAVTAFYADDPVPFNSPLAVGGAGSGTIQQITSVDGSINVTNPFGPVTDLAGKLPVLDFVSFDPVAGFVQIVSLNPNAPTLIATSGLLTFAGTETVRIEFGAAAIDMDQRGIGATAGCEYELWDDINGGGSTPQGIIGSLNISNNTYSSIPCYLFCFDNPVAGTHKYSITGYKQFSGGGPAGPSYVYGSSVTTPHVTRPGYLAVLLA